MEIKKTPEADLEKERIIFFLMGLALALSVFFVLMEWQHRESVADSDWTSLGPVFIEKEFEGANRQQEYVPAGLPVKSEIEIVYEDYVITNDIPVIERQENQVFGSSEYIQQDETPIIQSRKESIIPVEVKTNIEPVASSEIMPQFPGGQTELIRFIYQNIQYPSVALKQKIEGRVWCSFIVEKDGSISNIQLENGVYIFLDEEAIRVLKLMPAWIPGQTNGENVSVKVYIPIVFKR